MNPIEIALKEYATNDIFGAESNPRVLQYFDEIGQDWVLNDDTAWCAAFLNWVLVKAQKRQTFSLLARSFLNYGIPTQAPELGDVVVLWRIAPESGFGHVGLFVKEEYDKVYILGGNQSGQVNISSFPKSRILEYRKIPAGIAVSVALK